MEHLLSVWHEVSRQVTDATHILLVSDYDGTLAPIAPRPELVNLLPETRQLLESLVCHPRFTVSIISGRKLDDLKDRVRMQGIVYAGNHGLEIEGPGISYINPLSKELMPVLGTIVQVLRKALGEIQGAWVEDKGLSLSVHYRQVDSSRIAEVKEIVQRVAGGAQAAGLLKIHSGKKIYEIRPAVDWDKGKAVKFLISKCGVRGERHGLLPVFLGDDITDEDGFKAIERVGNGLSVFVGEPTHSSIARYFLRSPAEVAIFLSRLLEQAQRGPLKIA